MAPPSPQLILASASPRRQELLRAAGYTFIVHPADLDEAAYMRGNLLPVDLARELAIAKADAVATAHPDAVILAADTIVAFGDDVLGKPRDAYHARQMLQLLSGTTHLVITGIAVVHAGGHFARHLCVFSAVRMRLLHPAEIDAYVASNDWQGKAGGYGIQDPDPFVTRVSGSHSNIVGLPMAPTQELLAAAGIPAPASSTSPE
jgi:septum formation protein